MNVLVYVEAWTRVPARVCSGAYPPVRPSIVAAKFPGAYDLVRRDLGAPTREEIEPRKNVSYVDSDEAELASRHKAGCVAVQEAGTG